MLISWNNKNDDSVILIAMYKNSNGFLGAVIRNVSEPIAGRMLPYHGDKRWSP